MRVLTCLTQDHNFALVAVAFLMGLLGSYVSVILFTRTLAKRGISRLHWCFLSSLVAGAAIWATHFIAMLGYETNLPVTFDLTLTIVSGLVAWVGIAIALVAATHRHRFVAVYCAGATIGLSITAMHYIGMFAYRVDGIVTWLPNYVLASIMAAILASIGAIHQLRKKQDGASTLKATASLALAIISLHFIGMSAFDVTPIAGVYANADSPAFTAIAMSVFGVAFIVLLAGISVHVADRHAQDESRAMLQHMAHHDELTQTSNRRGFSLAIKSEREKLMRYGRPFSLFMIDLDRFKAVNDTLGHQVGDVLLRRVAERLEAAVRSGDFLARLGGDEFAVLAFGLHETSDAQSLASRIVEVVGRPYIIDGSIAEIGASVGVVIVEDAAIGEETLIQQADVAMYTAKNEGRGQYCLYESKLSEELNRKREIEADLRRACMRDDFKVVYQPVVDAASGTITGAEALLRWQSPDRGEVPPSEFVPIAEELGLVSRIGAGVLKKACLEAAGWPEELTVSVNVSPTQLLDRRLPRTVSEALAESGLASKRLELEITETALVDNDEIAMSILKKIEALGVRISLDDFGTGYSSLSYLHRFPIHRIKIDRSFVNQLPDDGGSVSIVQAISQIGQSLDLTITAEGIETPDQWKFVASNGCHNLQGFLFGKPMDSAELAALAKRTKDEELA